MAKKRSRLHVVPDSVIRQLDTDEVQVLSLKWMKAFGSKSSGINTDSYMWHVFSAGCFPCLSGIEARVAYKTERAATYIVLSNSKETGLVTSEQPDSCSDLDWYVFPPNLAWTMVFTHEDGLLGPYFARHPQYERLNLENKQVLRKVQQSIDVKRKYFSVPDN